MYSIYKGSSKGNLEEKLEIDGFKMGSHNKTFSVGDAQVKDINVIESRLASPLVTRKVMKKYNKLIAYLTELLVDDDDTGDTMREALNQIEKFRLEIKVKYRKYLKKKELELMSKQLVKLQKAANERLLEIHNSYLEMMSSRRSK